MPVVVTLERSGNPRRAVFASGAFLLVSVGLSAWLSAGRQAFSLAPRITPPGWPISFQPPHGWKLSEKDTGKCQYEDLRDPHRPRQLVVRLMPRPSHWTAAQVAAQVMGTHLALLGLLQDFIRPHRSAAEAEEAPLGQLPGARINMSQSGDYVHAGLLPSEDQPAVVVQYHTEGPFSPRDVQIYQSVADSIKPE